MAEQEKQLAASYYPQDAGMPSLPGDLKGSVGVCFSGGGSRACTAAMGQMRGLHHLQLLHRDKIKCISSVSGGTWASILYTFRSPDIDIETFLGGVVIDPGKLTWGAHSAENKAEILDYLDFNNLGMVPTRLSPELIIKTMIQLHDQYHHPASDLWIHAIGKLVLAPFNLAQVDADGNFLKYMGYTQQWIEDNPVKLNPAQLSAGDFDAVPDDPLRPYLITNTSVFANPTTLLRFEISPAYQGAFNALRISGNLFGGGYLDTYGLGSSNPEKLTDRTASLQQPKMRASLATAAALSSAFYAAIVEDMILKADGDIGKLDHIPALGFLSKEFNALAGAIDNIGNLAPRVPYWPVGELGSTNPPTRTVTFADGGNLENLGIVALLQRSCTSIISFINTMNPLAESNEGLIVDSELPPLFGYCPKKEGQPYRLYSALSKEELDKLGGEDFILRDNQVFPSTEFFPFLEKIAAASRGKTGTLGADPALFVQQLTTIKNIKFGVEAGLSTKVLWVYNNPVAAWRSQLSREVRFMMDLEVLDYDDFPNYNTISKIHLNARQVNLLAHLSCWNVVQNKDVFLSMWD
jgi:hypothetical protein